LIIGNTRTVSKSYTNANTKPELTVGVALLDGKILHATEYLSWTPKNAFPLLKEDELEAQTQNYDAEDLFKDQEEEPLGSQPMDG